MANREVRILLRTHTDNTPGDFSDYFICTADVFEVDNDGQLRNSSIGWLDYPSRYFDKLQVRAQADSHKHDFYGWEVSYAEPYSVRLGQAEAMAKTLRSIDRKLSRMNDRLGYVTDLASYLARFADVIGAYFIRHGEVPGNYILMSASDVRYWLQARLDEFAKQYADARA